MLWAEAPDLSVHGQPNERNEHEFQTRQEIIMAHGEEQRFPHLSKCPLLLGSFAMENPWC